MSISECEAVEVVAKVAAGNWRKFDSFRWYRVVNDPGDWTIVYTRNRDSSLIAQSNAKAIDDAMEPYTEGENPDAVCEHHSHWLCGWVDGYAIRVYRDGQITDAFKAYYDIVRRLADYPILDDDDYSRREYDATLENIENNRPGGFEDLPEGWEEEVYSWLSEHNRSALENRDDQGGCPTTVEIEEALEALGYERVDY